MNNRTEKRGKWSGQWPILSNHFSLEFGAMKGKQPKKNLFHQSDQRGGEEKKTNIKGPGSREKDRFPVKGSINLDFVDTMSAWA